MCQSERENVKVQGKLKMRGCKLQSNYFVSASKSNPKSTQDSAVFVFVLLFLQHCKTFIETALRLGKKKDTVLDHTMFTPLVRKKNTVGVVLIVHVQDKDLSYNL